MKHPTPKRRSAEALARMSQMIPPRAAGGPSTDAETTPPAGPPASGRVADLLAKMDAPLRSICEEIRTKLASARKADVSAHLAVALLVRQVVVGVPKYGGGAVKQIHLATGMSVKSLYRWATVAEAWPTPDALGAVISLHDGFGLSLTWSHLEEIARIEEESAREEFVNLAVTKSLRVADVRARVDEWLRQENAGARSSSTAAPDPLPASVSSLTKKIAAVSRIQSRWHETLGGLAGKSLSSEEVRALRAAVASQVQLRDALSQAIEEAEALLNSAPASGQPDSTANGQAPLM